MKKDDNQFKITLQWCNCVSTCKGISVELIYNIFIHAGLSTLELYPEDLDPENFYFQWPAGTKIQRLIQNLFKEGNGDHKYLRCPYLRDNNFEVLCSKIALDKVNLECV